MKRAVLYLTALLMMASHTVFGQGVEKVKDSKRSYNSIIDMLRGEPGVIINGSGEGGTMPKIYIRGIGTNTDQYQPLFIVDGLRTDNILYVQPENVHSITVIKDGTSSIYGMEGANGVIEIKTVAYAEQQEQEANEKKLQKKLKRKNRKSRKLKVTALPADSITASESY